ncbi:phosphotransferase [Rhodopirellula bahusiensis]|uniref:phosphotransferase n=1 Tax=Rhodopirellula bahusiensis TaxID=2014065 RepID=UPI003263FB5B
MAMRQPEAASFEITPDNQTESAILATPLPTVDGRWIVSDRGRHWQCTPWVDGTACGDSEASDGESAARVLQLGGEAIAKTHAKLANLPASATLADQAPRCFRDRMQRLRELGPWLSSGSLLREQLPGSVSQWRALLVRCVSVDGTTQPTSMQTSEDRRAYEELANRLMSAAELLVKHGVAIHSKLIAEFAERFESSPKGWRQSWVLRDVHREHILLDESRETVAGIIDHDAMDWDCPIVDLARWSGSFPVQLDECLSASRLELALTGYNRIASAKYGVELADGGRGRSFHLQSPTPEELALGETLVRLNAWVGMANWVDWIGLRRRVFVSSPERLSSRISGLIDSVCHFC